MDRKLVIIPTYNEKENIADIIAAVFALPGNFHVLIIDDNSPDGTAAIVKGLQEKYPEQLHLLERSGKLGLGTAYLTGFQWALEHGYDYVFEMDADFSHNPQDLLRLYRACEKGGADVAVGSRYCNGVSVVDWPISRILMSYFASAYVRGVLRMHVYDTTAGFVCYTRQVLETMDLNAVKMKGYGFQIEMKYTAWKLGFTIEEVPIIFTNRQKGTSKMSGGIFGEAFWGVIALRFRKITEAQQADQVPSSREGI
jgi:dolichol-phosphate mannosyltransferase